jgi:hypothetical protein
VGGQGNGDTKGKDGGKEEMDEEMEGDRTAGESPKMKKLESQNKILIGVLVAVILINLILRLF